LDEPGAASWDDPLIRPIFEHAQNYAALAARLAERTGRVDVDFAWMAGLLAPLGWLAVCALDAQTAAACLGDPSHADHPSATQQGHWGLDVSSIARRLARRWQLPPWLSAIVGHLALPAETAAGIGADLELFRLVQLAVGLYQKGAVGLGLEVGARPVEVAAALGLSAADLEQLQSPPANPSVLQDEASPAEQEWTAPADLPLLADLLTLAVENRRLADSPVVERLEGAFDQLHHALSHQRASEASRLQSLKLSTLAEFAAGAGHEINNPLAVISGQAQYLLGHLQITDGQLPPETEPADAGPADQSAMVKHSLQTIIGQAQRIHDILKQLMQFARPGRPQKRLLDLGAVIREVTLELGELAEQRHVRLVCPEPELPLRVHADPRQLRMALACLLRNAIEAAPAEGWAGVRAVLANADFLDLLVEDSGPGPAPQQLEHIFDPFYSGRAAGRGRGLGLPTAWRLAREHGGDVFFDDQSPGPTRFVLRLPREAAWDTVLGHGSENNNGSVVNPLGRATPGLGENPAKAG
jgi:signal transduction histidine kinase